MLLAGIPSEFRMSVVVDRSPSVRALEALRDDLGVLGVSMALFDAEEPALAWLESPPAARRERGHGHPAGL